MTGPAVVYVTGWGRSGSTVLNRVLAGSGVAGLGEVRWLWSRGVLAGQDCSCGQGWSACPVWGPTVRTVASSRVGTAEEVAQDIERTRRGAERRISLGQKLGHAHGAYLAALSEVYRGAASAAGASVLVDSSKAPAQALLARATGLPVVVVHLVRDPRAVAWSHRRAKKPPAGAVARVTPQRPTAYVTSRWLARNAYIDAKVRPDIRLRYEDVVADPAAAVGAIRQVLDRIRPPSSVTTPAWEGSGSGSQHLIAGNPGRFDAGPLVLRPDVEWATAQPRGARAVATLVSSPLLHRYGYPLRPDRP